MGSSASTLPPGTTLINAATGQPISVVPSTTGLTPVSSTGTTTTTTVSKKKDDRWWIVLVSVLAIVVVVVGIVLAILYARPPPQPSASYTVTSIIPLPNASSLPVPLNSLTSINPRAGYPLTGGAYQYTIQSVDNQNGLQAVLTENGQRGYVISTRYDNYGPSQRWTFFDVVNSNLYAIEGHQSLLAWVFGKSDVSGDTNSVILGPANWNDDPNQRYELVLISGNANDPVAGGVFAINSRQTTLGDCCSMASLSGKNYTAWQPWNWLGNPAQQWIIKVHNN